MECHDRMQNQIIYSGSETNTQSRSFLYVIRIDDYILKTQEVNLPTFVEPAKHRIPENIIFCIEPKVKLRIFSLSRTKQQRRQRRLCCPIIADFSLCMIHTKATYNGLTEALNYIISFILACFLRPLFSKQCVTSLMLHHLINIENTPRKNLVVFSNIREETIYQINIVFLVEDIFPASLQHTHNNHRLPP